MSEDKGARTDLANYTTGKYVKCQSAKWKILSERCNNLVDKNENEKPSSYQFAR